MCDFIWELGGALPKETKQLNIMLLPHTTTEWPVGIFMFLHSRKFGPETLVSGWLVSSQCYPWQSLLLWKWPGQQEAKKSLCSLQELDRGFGRTVGMEGEQPFNLNILICHLLYSRLGHRLKGNGLTEDLENPSSPIARRKKGLIPPGCVTA